MKVYKGTDKNMQCRGKQYELGKKEVDDGAIRCGDKGYHSCEAPFDVLRYYPNINGNRFFEAEAGGEIDKRKTDDTKLASSELTLKSEINFAGLVKAQIEYTRKKSKAGTADGDWSNLVGGDGSKLCISSKTASLSRRMYESRKKVPRTAGTVTGAQRQNYRY